jgi:CDP-glucose 4,6-dehydratase
MASGHWQGRSVFVTGATGLLGRALTRALVDAGADVVCLVRDWVPRSELFASHIVERVNVVRGDVVDGTTLERVLGEYEVRTVFHLAAQTIVGIANRNPISTFESNVKGTWALLEACRRSPLVGEVVVASSDKAYGDQEQLPYDESTPLAGRHPYDVSKSCADLIAQSYAHTYRLPVVITRCGNLYGPGDLNWNRLVPGTIRSVLHGERPVIRSDGTYVRDYFYVEDGVGSYLTLAEALAGDRSLGGHAFNFSNEQPMTVLDLTRSLLRLMGSALEPDVQGAASNEIVHQYLSAKKARERLRWSPKFTLAAGLSETIEWYRRFFERAGADVAGRGG